MDKIVAKYYGVNIIESCGYYYPEVNGDIECKSIREAKRWIKEIWLFVKENLEFVSDRLSIPRSLLTNLFLSNFRL